MVFAISTFSLKNSQNLKKRENSYKTNGNRSILLCDPSPRPSEKNVKSLKTIGFASVFMFS